MEIRGTIEEIYMRDFSSFNSYNSIIKIKDDHGNDYIVKGYFPYVRKKERVIVDVEPDKDGNMYVATGLKFIQEYNLFSLFKIVTTIKGIGQKTGKEIVDAVAKKRAKEKKPLVVSTIDEFYQDIEAVNIDAKYKKLIQNKLREFAIVDELVYIFGNSMPYRNLLNMASKIVLENKAEQVLSNLYLLVDFDPTLNINRLDTYIRREFNYDYTNRDRIEAYIKYAFHKFAIEYKFTILERDVLINYVQKTARVQYHYIAKVLDDMVEAGLVVKIDDKYMLKKYYEIEKYIAEKFKAIISQPIDEYIAGEVIYVIEQIIKHTEEETGIAFSDEQINAVKNAFLNRISIITGGAGTGKSTIIKLIYKIAKHLGLDPIVMTPTGKAANRLSDLGARTIHFVLGWDGVKANQRVHNKFIIIDEASMVDLEIAYELLSNIDDKIFLVFVGDPYQLPAVGSGALFEVMINSELFTISVLSHVYRQKGTSEILDLAHAINARNYQRIIGYVNKSGEQLKITVATPEKIVNAIKYLLSQNPNNIIILTPVRNIFIGNFNSSRFNYLARKFVKSHARVICIENDYERMVFNGDMGIITRGHLDSLYSDAYSDETIKVLFNGKEHEYNSFAISRYLEPAYAITVHKAQGSEFEEVVIIPILSEHVRYWDKKTLYTAVTRAKKKLIILTDLNYTQIFQHILTKREVSPKSYFADYMSRLSSGGDLLERITE